MTDGASVPVTGSDRPALVDPDDLPLVSAHAWWLDADGGAAATTHSDGVKRNVRMHRLVTGAESRLVEVDHRNHDRLDNRRSNLRSCTHGENMMNRRAVPGRATIYKGVSPYPRHKTKPWRGSIQVRGKSIHLGYFDTDLEAALAYNDAARHHFGDFAHLNEVPG